MRSTVAWDPERHERDAEELHRDDPEHLARDDGRRRTHGDGDRGGALLDEVGRDLGAAVPEADHEGPRARELATRAIRGRVEQTALVLVDALPRGDLRLRVVSGRDDHDLRFDRSPRGLDFPLEAFGASRVNRGDVLAERDAQAEPLRVLGRDRRRTRPSRGSADNASESRDARAPRIDGSCADGAARTGEAQLPPIRSRAIEDERVDSSSRQGCGSREPGGAGTDDHDSLNCRHGSSRGRRGTSRERGGRRSGWCRRTSARRAVVASERHSGRPWLPRRRR